MKIDDLIGILFLLFFIVGPALRGLLKPREPLVEVELPPEIEEMMRERAPRPQEPPQAARPKPAQAQTKPAASSPPAASAAPAAAAPGGGSLQTAEGHAAGSRSRQRIEEAQRDASDMAAEERAAFALTRAHKMKHAGLPLHPRGIVHGMLWHEVLGEPASRRLRRVRTRRRKLLS
ncbi:hypothetical protein [Oceanithermus profundus]